MSLQESRDASGALLLARTDIMLDIAGCYIMRNVRFFLHHESAKMAQRALPIDIRNSGLKRINLGLRHHNHETKRGIALTLHLSFVRS